jgi:hypothetical protein
MRQKLLYRAIKNKISIDDLLVSSAITNQSGSYTSSLMNLVMQFRKVWLFGCSQSYLKLAVKDLFPKLELTVIMNEYDMFYNTYKNIIVGAVLSFTNRFLFCVTWTASNYTRVWSLLQFEDSDNFFVVSKMSSNY